MRMTFGNSSDGRTGGGSRAGRRRSSRLSESGTKQQAQRRKMTDHGGGMCLHDDLGTVDAEDRPRTDQR